MSPSEDLDRLWEEYRATRAPHLRNRLVVQYAPLVKYVAGRLRTRMPDSTCWRRRRSMSGRCTSTS